MRLAQQECSSLEEGGGAQIVSSSVKSKVVDKAGKEEIGSRQQVKWLFYFREFRAIRGRVETGMKFKDDARKWRWGGGWVSRRFVAVGVLRGSNGRRDSVWPIGQDLLLEVRHATHMAILLLHWLRLCFPSSYFVMLSHCLVVDLCRCGTDSPSTSRTTLLIIRLSVLRTYIVRNQNGYLPGKGWSRSEAICKTTSLPSLPAANWPSGIQNSLSVSAYVLYVHVKLYMCMLYRLLTLRTLLHQPIGQKTPSLERIVFSCLFVTKVPVIAYGWTADWTPQIPIMNHPTFKLFSCRRRDPDARR